MNTIRVSSSLDQDQARRLVGPDLGPNCLQMSSADNTSRVLHACLGEQSHRDGSFENPQ